MAALLERQGSWQESIAFAKRAEAELNTAEDPETTILLASTVANTAKGEQLARKVSNR